MELSLRRSASTLARIHGRPAWAVMGIARRTESQRGAACRIKQTMKQMTVITGVALCTSPALLPAQAVAQTTDSWQFKPTFTAIYPG